jgi:hypothetical protein
MTEWFVRNARDARWLEDDPSYVLAVRSRLGPNEVLYPVDPVALEHKAGVEIETGCARGGVRRLREAEQDAVSRRVFA